MEAIQVIEENLNEETQVQGENIESGSDPLSEEAQVGLLEALLFVHSESLSLRRLAELSNLSFERVKEIFDLLVKRYKQEAYGFELCEVAGKVQLRTKSLYSRYIRILTAAKPKRLSAAALETLAIIAYQQPIVKSEIEKIRGVDTSPTLKTLLEKRLIKIVGHQATVGQPALYATTEDFLKVFGLNGLPDLPSLREIAKVDGDPGEGDEDES
jgi:segregation and condensation protein B